MTLYETLKQNKVPIAKGLLLGSAITLAMITADAAFNKTSLLDIATDLPRSAGEYVTGALIGMYEALRSAVKK